MLVRAHDRERRVLAEFLESDIEQVAQDRVHAVVSPGIGLVVHGRVDVSLEQIDEEVLALLVEDLGVAERPAPVLGVEIVVLGHPLGRGRDVVEEVGRLAGNEEHPRLDVAIDADVRRRVVPAGARGITQHVAHAAVPSRGQNVGVGQSRDLGTDQIECAVVRVSLGLRELVVLIELGEGLVVVHRVEVGVIPGVVQPIEVAAPRGAGDGERIGVTRAEGVERPGEPEVRVARLLLLPALPGAGGVEVRVRHPIRAAAVDVVVDEEVVELRLGIGAELAEVEALRQPLDQPVLQLEPVDEPGVGVEGEGQGLAAVGVHPRAAEHMTCAIDEQRSDARVRCSVCNIGDARNDEPTANLANLRRRPSNRQLCNAAAASITGLRHHN